MLRSLIRNSPVHTATKTTMASNLTINSMVMMNSSHKIPQLGFGVYQTPVDQSSRCCTEAFAAGYRHIDSAAVYRNESGCGAAVRSASSPPLSIPRASIFYTSKIPSKKLGYDMAKANIAKTLADTGLDYVDLMLLHSPYGGSAARKAAWRALVEGVEEGKIRSIGVSNYGVHHLDELEGHIKELEEERGKGKGGVISVGQWEVHPWCQRKDIVEWCEKRGVVVQAYAPIVRGEKFGKDEGLKSLAKKYGVSEAQVLIRWSLQKGYVPLPKSVTSSRIVENASVYEFELTEEEVQGLGTGEYSPVCWDPTTSGLDN